jgi:hypothetical protein
MEQFQSIMGKKILWNLEEDKEPTWKGSKILSKEQQCNTELGSGEQLEDPKEDGGIGSMTLNMPERPKPK